MEWRKWNTNIATGTLSRATELGKLAFKLLTNLDGTLFCVNIIAQLLGKCF